MQDFLTDIEVELMPIMDKAKEMSTAYGISMSEALDIITWFHKKDYVKELFTEARAFMDTIIRDRDEREARQKEEYEARIKKEEEEFHYKMMQRSKESPVGEDEDENESFWKTKAKGPY